MTGLKRNNIAIETMHIPERKKPCLAIVEDNCSTIIGQFRDDEAAEAFWKALDYVAFGNGDFTLKYADKEGNQPLLESAT